MHLQIAKHNYLSFYHQVVLKKLYGQSARDHGSLGFFHCLLNHSTVTADVKRAVDDTLDFLEVVIKGHFLAVACRILGITSLDNKVILPSGTFKVDASQQLQYSVHSPCCNQSSPTVYSH